MHVKEYYLSRMGIQQWVPRPPNNFYYLVFPLKSLVSIDKVKGAPLTGYLVIENENDYLQPESEICQLAGAIAKAMALELGPIMPSNQLNLKENVDFFIFMGQEQNSFLKQQPHSPKKITLYSPKQLLASPLLKKEVWRKLRNFT